VRIEPAGACCLAKGRGTLGGGSRPGAKRKAGEEGQLNVPRGQGLFKGTDDGDHARGGCRPWTLLQGPHTTGRQHGEHVLYCGRDAALVLLEAAG